MRILRDSCPGSVTVRFLLSPFAGSQSRRTACVSQAARPVAARRGTSSGTPAVDLTTAARESWLAVGQVGKGGAGVDCHPGADRSRRRRFRHEAPAPTPGPGGPAARERCRRRARAVQATARAVEVHPRRLGGERVVLEPLAQAREDPRQRARHLHLADAEPGADLLLGHVVVEAQAEDEPLTLAQRPDGAAQCRARVDRGRSRRTGRRWSRRSSPRRRRGPARRARAPRSPPLPRAPC